MRILIITCAFLTNVLFIWQCEQAHSKDEFMSPYLELQCKHVATSKCFQPSLYMYQHSSISMIIILYPYNSGVWSCIHFIVAPLLTRFWNWTLLMLHTDDQYMRYYIHIYGSSNSLYMHAHISNYFCGIPPRGYMGETWGNWQPNSDRCPICIRRVSVECNITVTVVYFCRCRRKNLIPLMCWLSSNTFVF